MVQFAEAIGLAVEALCEVIKDPEASRSEKRLAATVIIENCCTIEDILAGNE